MTAAMSADKPLTVAMVDIDKFKSVNDRFTHSVGARVLKTVAAIMSAEMRQNDLPVRCAGDEFVLLLDNATEPQAALICGRLCEAVAVVDWEFIAPGLQMSASIGTSEMRFDNTAGSELQRSDESMYRAKA